MKLLTRLTAVFTAICLLLLPLPAHAGKILTGYNDQFTVRSYPSGQNYPSSQFTCTMSLADYNSYFTTGGNAIGIANLDGNSGTTEFVTDKLGSLELWSISNYGGGSCTINHTTSTTVSPNSYRVKAIGDLNGDGKDDIIFRDVAAGKTIVWYMNGTSMSSNQFITPDIDSSWDVEGTAKLNADSVSDLIWYQPGGLTQTAWFMGSGTGTYASWSMLADRPNSTTRLTTSGEWDTDGKKDDLLYSQTGVPRSPIVWYMNGASKTGELALEDFVAAPFSVTVKDGAVD